LLRNLIQLIDGPVDFGKSRRLHIGRNSDCIKLGVDQDDLFLDDPEGLAGIANQFDATADLINRI
jgi:hypothetical protein